ncbi:MAG: hypothetical protein ACK47F_01340 [Flavobacteriales bacterium]
MKKIVGCILLAVVLLSCGGNRENRALNEYVSAFLKESKTLVVFGKADINTILNKSEYKKIPKLGVVVDNELNEFKKSLNTETPIYFALEGPFMEDGTPETSYAFFEVVNEDSLVAKVTQMGFDLEKTEGFHFFQSGDVCMGVKNNLSILISKKKEFDGKKMLSEAFDKVRGDLSEGKVDDILASNGDIVMGVSVENLYGTSNTDLSSLSTEKQKSLNDMVKDSYVQTTLAFEKGATVLKTRNLFSQALMDKLFFKADPSGSIVKKLGTGNPKLALALNLDMKKLQSFLNEYSPNTLAELGESMGGPAAFVLASGGESALSQLLSGEVGVAMVGEPTVDEGISDFNFYVGLGSQGKLFAKEAKSFLSLGMARVDLDGKGLAAYSNAAFLPKAGKRLSIPAECSNFGKKGITGFLYLDGVDLSSFEFEEEQKIILLIKYISFEMDENGATVYIKAKDGKENMLKQAVDVIVEELSGKISNMAI